ncbi:109aa long hypothetical protein [Pyrococcus horikoshii OT3]|uniref:Uncharacterized protein n=1 Tax=Pyrococcus horikoshii (strain ATCC 700860 / DSM 12428 / JCM 9974 / NBRC 100139 / OT-3) TaxID=70601 RepID=O58401_PYRHO|nr:109aa long hypothetical protein [Pyrococcus horikoshii OT3]
MEVAKNALFIPTFFTIYPPRKFPTMNPIFSTKLKKPNIEPTLVESSDINAECAGAKEAPNAPWVPLRDRRRIGVDIKMTKTYVVPENRTPKIMNGFLFPILSERYPNGY